MTSSPTPAVLPDARARSELSLLYNHADDDSRQFTREQMIVAMSHGYRLATPPASDAAVPAYPDNTYTPYGRRSVHNLAKALGIVEQDPTVVSVINKASDEITFLRALAAAPKVASDTGAGLRSAIMAEVVNKGVWSLRFTFGRGDEARDRMRATAAALATDATDGGKHE